MHSSIKLCKVSLQNDEDIDDSIRWNIRVNLEWNCLILNFS